MAKEKSKGLGKGLGALFGGDVSLDALTHPPVSTAVEEQEPPVQEQPLVRPFDDPDKKD